ncbi:hypothetical protein [Pontibacter akesuensis]|uniref:Uncharacterized protein n=1 Tax=Pontibacter akesuensis TaxID=388950 RepID=A0A1I7K7X8_9BACT|nr:hypothetical protein [Pontibacter akesuensis]GHA74477.1 hypothetical protein GCM10007389_30240 [Pontibacter akesuensis]SFU93462.1 hypothetical protein SAMN04487941_3483 [Pontibacter akesuensis]
MKHINQIILTYLYKNDNGEFIDVTPAFKSKIPPKEKLDNAFYNLQKFVEREFADVIIWNLGDPVPNREAEPLSRVRLTQEGRDYLKDQAQKEETLSLSKASLKIAAVSVIVAIIAIAVAYATSGS